MPTPESAVFVGRIAGFGTASGVRVVLGHWRESPFGAFADVMVERADGERILIAPSSEVAKYVSTTYTFDRVMQVDVRVSRSGSGVSVEAGPLAAGFTIGRRPPLGWLLHSAVPRRLATSTSWLRAIDPAVRVVLPGVRVHGSAQHGRTEFYGATDVHTITEAHASWEGADLGGLRPVRPAPSFGFSSTPARPSIVDLVTTIREGTR